MIDYYNMYTHVATKNGHTLTTSYGSSKHGITISKHFAKDCIKMFLYSANTGKRYDMTEWAHMRQLDQLKLSEEDFMIFLVEHNIT